MKHKGRQRRIAPRLLSVLLAVSLLPFSVPMKAEAATTAAVQYVYKNGTTSGDVTDRAGIRSVIIDGVTYYDIHDGEPDPEKRTDMRDQYNFYKAVLNSGKDMPSGLDDENAKGKDTLLGQWSTLAEHIFNTHSDYSAAVHADGSFWDNFATKDTKDKEGYTDISDALTRESPGSNGNQGSDYTSWTGLGYTNSLSNVRQKAADNIASAIDRKITGDDILKKSGNIDTPALGNLNDDSTQDVIYSMVTCVDRSGSTAKYTYNTFGIAFYDFSLSVIAGEGLEYISSAQEYGSLEAASNAKAPGVSYSNSGTDNPMLNYYRNESTEEADIGMSFGQSNSVSVSNSLQTSDSYSFTEMIGSETLLGFSVQCLAKLSETIQLQFTCGQTLSTAYTETESCTQSSDNTISSSIKLPAQTAVGIESSGGTTSVTLDYDCPVAINYKVAIYSLSGDVYDDNIWTQSFETAGYKQKQFSTIFGADSPKGGTTAMENLYNRAIKNVDVPNYEESYGQTVGWVETQDDGFDPDTMEALDWDGILQGRIEAGYEPEKETVKVKYVEVNADGTTSKTIEEQSLAEKIPVGYEYEVSAPGSFDKEDVGYNIYTASTIDGNSEANSDLISVNETYKKIVQPVSSGEIESLKTKVKDKLDKNEITQDEYTKALEFIDSMNTVTFYYTKATKSNSLTATAQLKKINKLKSEIPDSTITDLNEKVNWMATHSPMSFSGGTISYDESSMNSNINQVMPLYPLSKIQVTNGVSKLNMTQGDTFDVSSIELAGKNNNGVPYYGFSSEKGYWKLVDEDGKEINSSVATLKTDARTGITTLTAGETEGTVYLKYYINNNTYKSLSESEYTTNGSITTAMVEVNVSAKPFNGTVIAEGTTTTYVNETVNLTGNQDIIARALDSTGKKISNVSITWETQLDEADGIKLNGNILSFTKSGEFKIRAVYQGIYSDWVTIKVLPERKLDSLEITDDTEILSSFIYNDPDTPNNIDLKSLTISATDQYEGKWEDFDDLVWLVNDKKITGDTLSITGAGSYKIQAECDGVLSNALTLEVKDPRQLASLSIFSDLSENGLGIGTAYRYDLKNVKITAKDQYGDVFDISRMYLTWDADGKYAKVDNGENGTGDLVGLVKGSSFLQASIGDVKSNTIDFNVLSKPYVKTLSTVGDNSMVEGTDFDLDTVVFTAEDQNGKNYSLSEAERNSITWELTDQGTIKSENASLDNNTLKVPAGTLQSKTGTVVLKASFTNVNEKVASVPVTVVVKSQPVLETLKLEKKDDSVLHTGENAYLKDYFSVTALDQHGDKFSLTDVALTWSSDNENAFVITDNTVIEAVNPGASSNISVQATNSLDQIVTSNKATLSVPEPRCLNSIKLEGTPEAIDYGKYLKLSNLKTTCYDIQGKAFTEADLKAYPAQIVYTLEDPEGTGTTLDTETNTLTAGTKSGYITLKAAAADNGSILQDKSGNEIIASAKIYIGPLVNEIDVDEDSMDANGGNNVIILRGFNLINKIKVGLFDIDGNLINVNYTEGDSTEQKVVINVPTNINGGDTKNFYVKFAIDNDFGDILVKKIIVSNLIPAREVQLDKQTLVMEPDSSQKLTATVTPGNTTDNMTWTSSNPAVVTVDQNGQLKATAPGKATVTVKAKSGKTASCNVTVGLRKGDTFTKGIYTYKVTDSKVDGTGTLTVTGFVKGRSTKNVVIASQADWNQIPYQVTAIGTKAFKGNKNIVSVDTGNVQTVGKNAFEKCTKMTKCVVSDSVKTVKKYAFYNCYGLKKVTIGKNVETIESHAFCNNKKITSIVIKSKKLKTLGKPHVFIQVNKATVTVPASKYNTYKKLLSKCGLGKCKFKKK